MTIKIKKILLYLLAIQILFITLASISHAATCSNNWLRPSLQTMETEIMYATLTEHANGERYLFIKQGKSVFNVYYLRGALLVKGLDDAEINYDNIFWLPMAFARPMYIVSQAVSQGPCSIKQKTMFSLSDAEGEVSPLAQGMLSYKFTASANSKSTNAEKIHFSGTMQFTPPLTAPHKDSDVRGYKLVGQTKPYPVIGSADLPVTTLGELRRLLIEKKNSSKSWKGPMPEIIPAPEEKEDIQDRKEIYPFIIGAGVKFYGFVDKKAQVVLETPCLIINDFHDDIAICSNILKAGYINKAGKVIVEPQYGFHEYTDFSDGLAAVKKNGSWGFIDKTGKFVIEPMFSSYETLDPTPSFSEGLAAMKNNKGWGYVDKAGKFVIEPQFEKACNFHEGLAAVRNVGKDGKWGFINKKGHIVIEPQFDPKYYRDLLDGSDPRCPYFSENLAAMKNRGKWGFIDKTGKFVVEPQFEYVRNFSKGFVSVKKQERKYVIIDTTGKYITEEYNYISDFSDGMALITAFNGKEFICGYIDNVGRVIVEPIFGHKTQNFSDGLAAVNKNGKYGYINKTGQFTIEPQFESAGSFKNGVANVKKDGKFGLIDKSGQIFAINDNVCGHDVIKNGKGQITWPKNIKELCQSSIERGKKNR